jgi:hypothetical protein
MLSMHAGSGHALNPDWRTRLRRPAQGNPCDDAPLICFIVPKVEWQDSNVRPYVPTGLTADQVLDNAFSFALSSSSMHK